jgi:Tol biopolymer transport system component
VNVNGAAYPFWSPDSRSIGFFSDATLKRLDLDSGAIRTLASAPGGGRGGSWSEEGTIVFSPSTSAPLYQVAAVGGPATAATTLDASQQTDHRFPVFLPDGRHFLFFVYGPEEAEGIYVGSLDEPGTARKVTASNSAAVFLAPDVVLFARQGALLAGRLGPDLQLAGEPESVSDQVLMPPNTFGRVALSAAANVIAFRSRGEERQLLWLGRDGQRQSAIGEPDSSELRDPRLSHDGRTLAVNRTIGGNTDIWLIDLARGGSRRLAGPGRDQNASWSPDDRFIAYDSDQTGNADVFIRNADGTGAPRLLLASPEIKNVYDWTPDSAFLLYSSLPSGVGRDLWALPMKEGAANGSAAPVAQTEFVEALPRLSPDGRWVAFQSNETGRNEVHVQRFLSESARTRVSTTGGRRPIWSRDGRELYYVAPDNWLTSVSVQNGPETIVVGRATPLFQLPPGNDEYDVSLDGRFVVPVVTKAQDPITVVLNWRPRD